MNSKISLLLLCLLIPGCLGTCSYQTINPGSVGVKVNLYGSNRGVQDTTIVTGRVWYNTWSERIYTFPTFLQYKIWTRNGNEGNTIDESITFTSKDGIMCNADVAATYTFEREQIPKIFVTLRETPDQIADTYLRSKVRQAFMDQGTKLTAIEINSSGISILNKEVLSEVEQWTGPMGIHFDSVYVINK